MPTQLAPGDGQLSALVDQPRAEWLAPGVGIGALTGRLRIDVGR
jgi:hypothetical protein